MTPTDPDDILDDAAPATFVPTPAFLATLDADTYSALVTGRLRFVALDDGGVHVADVAER